MVCFYERCADIYGLKDSVGVLNVIVIWIMKPIKAFRSNSKR